eukprot:g737.t1
MLSVMRCGASSCRRAKVRSCKSGRGGFGETRRLASEGGKCLSSSPRIFSGIQPTGAAPHIGNYLGALRKWVALQNTVETERSSLLYSIVDLHALTSSTPGADIRQQSREMAAALLACGISPSKSIVYVQSDVNMHAELCWLLSCITPIGNLQRMTQFKEKSAKSKSQANLGLFSYPVLQAADILLYRATDVPVGEDQRQHLELSRTIADKFNNFVGDASCLVPPRAMITSEKSTERLGSLRDATKKMSKSDPSDLSRINLTDSPDQVALKIRKAKTDAIPGLAYDPDTRPDVSNLIGMYAAFREIEMDVALTELETHNMGSLKSALTEVLVDRICPIGEEIRRLLSETNYIDGVLQEGAEDAQKIASSTMRRVKRALNI